MTRQAISYLLLGVALLLTVTHRTYAQGYGSDIEEYYQAGCTVEVSSFIEIDDSLDMEAETQSQIDLASDCGPYNDESFSQLIISQDGAWIWNSGYPYGSTGGGPTGDSQDYYGTAQGGSAYGADGIVYIGYYSDDFTYNAEGNWTYLGDAFSSASTAPTVNAPYITSMTPSSGTAGDNNVSLQINGQNLLNSEGSLPSFTTSPSGLHITAQSGTSTQINATYSVDANTGSQNGLIDVDTDGGSSNDWSFQIYENFGITALDPSSWTADSNPFTLHISGSGFGTSPTVNISPSDITVGSSQSSSDTDIYVTVTVPTSESATQATVTVNANGNNCQVVNCLQPGGGSGGSGSNGQAQALASVSAQTCPTSVTIGQTGQQPLTADNPPYFTGVGILALMSVGPSSGNFQGVTITENVTPTTNSCPVSIKSYTDFPTVTDATSTTFHIGGPIGWEGVPYPSIADAFYDSHLFKSTSSVLTGSGTTSCTSNATQVYKCNGQVIGQFFLKSTFQSGTINGQPVTFVTITKQ